jgi:SSS family solute:Na+ symporter
MRISTILFLVSLVFQQMTGASSYACIISGGAVIATYTVLGGMRAIVWTQFVQAFLLWFGAITCLIMVIGGIDGGIPAVISTAMANHKFMLGDLDPATQQLVPVPWFALRDKAILMMLVIGLVNWLLEYSANQNVIQKYVSAKNPKEATRSIWICCFLSVPTWAFFMFLGTSLYVYFQQHSDPTAQDILSGANGMKAEAILPYFCVRAIPTGLAGIVITGILSAAMSASASSINAISAVGITDVYKRHLVKDRDERHYVTAARLVSAASCLLMMGGATLFLAMSKLTLQDLGTKLAALLGGGILGIYLLGFLTRRGSARSAGVGIACTVVFTTYMAACEWKYITKELFMGLGCSEGLSTVLAQPIHTYYVGIFGHLIMFVVVYLVASLFEREKRDLTNLTVWTTQPVAEEE